MDVRFDKTHVERCLELLHDVRLLPLLVPALHMHWQHVTVCCSNSEARRAGASRVYLQCFVEIYGAATLHGGILELVELRLQKVARVTQGAKWMRREQKGAGGGANLGGVDADGTQDLQRDQAAAEAASKIKLK